VPARLDGRPHGRSHPSSLADTHPETR
jgi:hypothetical protein